MKVELVVELLEVDYRIVHVYNLHIIYDKETISYFVYFPYLNV